MLPVQAVVLINGQEIKDYSFANGIFRTTCAPSDLQPPNCSVILPLRLCCPHYGTHVDPACLHPAVACTLQAMTDHFKASG